MYPLLHDRAPDARTDQRVELVLKIVEGRMGVKLGVPRRKDTEQLQDIILGNAAVLKEAKDSGGVRNPRAEEARFSVAGKQAEDERMGETVKPAAAAEWPIDQKRIVREAKRWNGMLHQKPKHGGMKVEMEVAVHVIEPQAGARKLIELSGYLVLESGGGGKEILKARGDGRVTERRSERRVAATKGEMEADRQIWMSVGELDGFIKGTAVHHEAGGGQNSIAMGLDDSGVNGGGTTEVVSRDNEPFFRGNGQGSQESERPQDRTFVQPTP